MKYRISIVAEISSDLPIDELISALTIGGKGVKLEKLEKEIIEEIEYKDIDIYELS